MQKIVGALLALCLAALLTGCATHANIEMPLVNQSGLESFSGKSINYQLYYSQPEPGLFTGGEKQAMKPVEEVNLSVASARVLQKIPRYIESQLPASSRQVGKSERSDYTLLIEMDAKNKRGPAYSNHQFGKSLGKGMLTMGLGPSHYKIIADFNVNYKLKSNGRTLYQKSYQVNDAVNHQKSDFESYSSLDDYSGQLLEKHMVLTLNSFLKDASRATTAMRLSVNEE